jgi:hypothetical protein
MATANFDLLVEVARSLRPLLSEVVFLGGCTTELFVTDSGAAEVRPTADVDVVVEITSPVKYADFSDRLRELGFKEDTREHAPLCRWLINGNQLDVMPMDEKILGYSNPWYAAAIKFAQYQNIAEDLPIRVITAPYFVATKIVAFKHRGNSDYQASSDLEDIVAVIDGRASIVDEIRTQEDSVRTYIAEEMGRLMDTTGFREALPGYVQPDVGSQGRVPIIEQRIRQIVETRPR